MEDVARDATHCYYDWDPVMMSMAVIGASTEADPGQKVATKF